MNRDDAVTQSSQKPDGTRHEPFLSRMRWTVLAVPMITAMIAAVTMCAVRVGDPEKFGGGFLAAALVLVAASALVLALWGRALVNGLTARRFSKFLQAVVIAVAAVWLVGNVSLAVVPRLAWVHEPVYVAAMKSNLMNLMRAQEALFGDSARYAVEFDVLGLRTDIGVVVVFDSATEKGGIATATHESTRSASTRCVVAWGDMRNPLDSLTKREPRCVVTDPWFGVLVR